MGFPTFIRHETRRTAGHPSGRAAPPRTVSLAVTALFALSLAIPAAPAAGKRKSLLTWGFRERIRQEYLRNCFDLENDEDDDRNYLRFRTQIWLDLRPSDGITLHAGLNNEHREFLKPDLDEADEIIVENLYLRWEGIGGSPVTIVAGRQDLDYGEGFLVLDGGPLDGSRTRYVNAARVIIGDEDRAVELHWIDDPRKDDYLPVIHSQRRDLIEWDERGWGIHYSDKQLFRGTLEAYYFYKREARDDGSLPKTKLSTVGVRVSGRLHGDIGYAAEGACQFGSRGGWDRTGLGALAHATYSPDLPYRPSLTVGAIYLSGDDRGSADYEGWDPLYSRWPKWSDLYIYTLVNEVGAAYWQNLWAPNISVGARPVDDVEFTAAYYHLGAPQRAWSPYSIFDKLFYRQQPSAVIGSGRARGHFSMVRLKWNIDSSMYCYVLWERLDPGDFYRDGSDTVHFLRWELMYTF